MLLTDLNLDCLLHIFSYCNLSDLLNLSAAHLLFRDVIDENIFYAQTQDLLMCGHRNAPKIQERTQQPLTYANRLSIGANWIAGKYREHEYFNHVQMFATKMQLERDCLYITHMCYLRQHRRLHYEPLQRRYKREIATQMKSDIADFVKKRDTIFAGRTCGSCFIHEAGYATEQRLHSVKEYLFCLDFAADIYVTSTNCTAKIWRRADELGLVNLDLMHEIDQSYKSLHLSSSADRLIGGLYTDINRRALREFDIQTGKESILQSNTLSIYDLKLKDENIIFTANFDTTFRMYDRRTNRDEGIWEDPFDSSFYCLDYDGLYAVLCGAKYHSRVNLYDIRVPGKYVQLYFPNRNRVYQPSSPVHSIACDSRYLYIATDHNLRVFDFKADCAQSRDYRDLFSEIRRV